LNSPGVSQATEGAVGLLDLKGRGKKTQDQRKSLSGNSESRRKKRIQKYPQIRRKEGPFSYIRAQG